MLPERILWPRMFIIIIIRIVIVYIFSVYYSCSNIMTIQIYKFRNIHFKLYTCISVSFVFLLSFVEFNRILFFKIYYTHWCKKIVLYKPLRPDQTNMLFSINVIHCKFFFYHFNWCSVRFISVHFEILFVCKMHTLRVRSSFTIII